MLVIAKTISTLGEHRVKILYVDEAGCTGAVKDASDSVMPTLIIGGLLVDHEDVRPLTTELIKAKKKFFPKILPFGTHEQNWIKHEIKGADLRRSIRASRNRRRHSFGFLEECLILLKKYNVKIMGRVWVKAVGHAINGNSIYTSSAQSMLSTFQHHLHQIGGIGISIFDARNKHLNSIVSHSIFTQKYRAHGDAYPNIVETPLFAHAENHACLQLSDIVFSGLLTPIALHAYCQTIPNNTHFYSEFEHVRPKFGAAVEVMQYRYSDPKSAKRRGGMIVADGISHQSGIHLFKSIAPAVAVPTD